MQTPPASPPAGPVPDDSALDQVLPINEAQALLDKLIHWAQQELLTLDVGLQASLIVAALIPAAIFGPRLKSFIDARLVAHAPFGVLRRAAQALAHIGTPLALYFTWQVFNIALKSAGRPTSLLTAALSLLTAWIAIRLVTLVIRSPFWSRVAFYIAWPIAALNAFGFLDNVVTQLKAFAIPLGQSKEGKPIDISALDVVQALIIFAALFWAANLLARFVERRIEQIDELTPSLKTMLVKVMNVLLPVIALIIALQMVGFNLATLTIFGGAVGLGIGLGLQKTISNFISGFALIADKSLKPGDVIEVGDAYGWITAMGARYVTVRTRDGAEHLIPNDTLTNEGVVNWSHADRIVRLHAPFGVSYATKDMRLVKRLAEEAAAEGERVLKSPQPQCNMKAWGDSSVDFDLRFWINDPANGVSNLKSEIYFRLWDKFAEHGVEIPFPQQDLHVRSVAPAAAAALGGAAPGTAPE